MARSSRRSLAGTATAAAKRVIGRRGRAGEDEVETSGGGGGASKKTSTKKTAAKKAAAKKTPATKTATKKAPATKTATKKAPATKAATKKAPATKTAAKKAPAKKAATETSAKKAPAKKTATKKAAKKAPATKAATEKQPAKKAPAKKTAATKAPAKKASTKKAPTKKAPKKAPVSALAVREDERAWTKAELDEVLTELHSERDKLVARIGEAETELAGLMKDSGDGAGQDQADMGATSFERDHELTVVNNERDMLAQVERALVRIDDGTYGQCESCGQPIGKNRLMAFPRATLCLSCKQREERR